MYRARPETENNIEKRFRRTNVLTRRKLLEYIPVMIVTNMSVFLLTTVDGLVAGNFVSSEALASVNIFLPGVIAICVISTLVSAGAGTSLSTCMGRNDMEAIQRTKSAVRSVMILGAIATAVLQFPILYAIMASYDLTPEVSKLAWEYAIGMMITLPLSLISSVGSYQLTILGRMRVLMFLTLGEGMINLIMDLFFAVVLDLGVAGIGFGTACANAFRCTATLIYMNKKTDILHSGHPKARLAEIKDILYCGIPEGAGALMVAVQNYFMMRIILDGFGPEGGVIKGVCFLTYNIINMAILGIQGGMRPLAGLFAGADDTKALRTMMRQGILLCASFTGILALVMEVFPMLMYRINGVTEIPEGGLLSLRLYLVYFVIFGVDILFRLYFANRKDSKFATAMTIVGNATLPFFSLLLYHFLSAPFMWLGYLMTELLIFAMSLYRYRWWLAKDRNRSDDSEKVLFLTVKPEEAVEASRMIRRFADEKGVSSRIAYRMSLCMEEMVAYAVESQKNPDIQIQIMCRFADDEGRFMMIDDGRCIALDENDDTKTLITDNYGLLKKISKSVEYQYVLNMNYTVFTF